LFNVNGQNERLARAAASFAACGLTILVAGGDLPPVGGYHLSHIVLSRHPPLQLLQ